MKSITARAVLLSGRLSLASSKDELRLSGYCGWSRKYLVSKISVGRTGLSTDITQLRLSGRFLMCIENKLNYVIDIGFETLVPDLY
jgi:hypothetical protein